jgi:hypothetical protein
MTIRMPTMDMRSLLSGLRQNVQFWAKTIYPAARIRTSRGLEEVNSP